jgi:hypothetical protein
MDKLTVKRKWLKSEKSQIVYLNLKDMLIGKKGYRVFNKKSMKKNKKVT